jgi:hypothetical protein
LRKTALPVVWERERARSSFPDPIWYLTAVPELMVVAAGKFERFAQAKEVDYVQ